jgi:L-lactate dehydrogenase complex protein LldE
LERLALFVSCMVDLFRPRTAVAAVAVLERRGASVGFPREQTCCGQFAYNAGHWEQALAMAGTLLDALASFPADAVVALSGSCAAMVIDEYPKLLEWALTRPGLDSEAGRLQALQEAVSPRLLDLSQWLARHPVPEADRALTPATPVALHVGCHMRRILRATDEPRAVLEQVGCPVRDIPDADQCCGFGGTYSMTEPEVSTALADQKLAAIQATRDEGALALTSGDWGCLLHLQGRLSREDDAFPVLHLAELVDLADRGELTRSHLENRAALGEDRL